MIYTSCRTLTTRFTQQEGSLLDMVTWFGNQNTCKLAVFILSLFTDPESGFPEAIWVNLPIQSQLLFQNTVISGNKET